MVLTQGASAQLLTGYGDSPAPSVEPVFVAPVFEKTPVIQKVEAVDEPADQETFSSVGFLTAPSGAISSNANSQPEKEPLNIEADTMRYDDASKTVSAQGNVIIMQDGRILRADDVEYAVEEDRVRARGNVVLNEENGDIHFAQDAQYFNELQNGSVDHLETTLSDGSRFSAEQGVRENAQRTVMKGASYTSCEACQQNPDKAVPWQIVASDVTHDEEEARVSYRNARFNVYGVPIVYTPYFSHPDGSIKRKSGFLSPSLGFRSDLGGFAENNYYWAIADDKDATLGVVAYTDVAPLGLFEYRQRWRNAGLTVNGGVTHSDFTDENSVIRDELRGHIFANGLWDINDEWRSGVEIEYVSDNQYADQYNISDEDVLQNTIYAERFSGRNYATGFVQLYQDIRTSDLETDQPGVLPELYASFIGDAGDVPFVKGRWDASFGLLSLFRDGNEQDVIRASTDLGWKRRLVSDYGLVSNVDLTLRGDAYYVNDNDVSTTITGQESGALETRFFPQVHIESAYPVARNFEKAQLMFEPLVAISASNENNQNDDIPNEDSQDVQLDSSNLFTANRFPGADLVEDRSRVTYGVRSALNGYKGSSAEVFLGQSYRLDNDVNPFDVGSGLDDQSSDIVGYIKGDLNSRYKMQYRFQYDNEDLTPERHELDAYGDWNRFRLGVNYLYAQPVEGLDVSEVREQISTNAQLYLNDKWRIGAFAQHDLGIDPGLRRGSVGVDYFGQCVSWSLQAVRNITEDSSGDNDTEILFRLGLRNLSDFVESGLREE